MSEEEEIGGQESVTESGAPSYGIPVVLVGGGLVLEASGKAIAKSMASGLQDRANIEGVIAVIAAVGILIGIGLAIRTFLARKKGAT